MQVELPIAWLQLRAQKTQTFWAIVSITFITVLLFMQIKSRTAFLDAAFEMPLTLRPYGLTLKEGVIKGLFTLGSNEANYSHLLTSDVTFMDFFGRDRKNINIGVIHLKPGADSYQVQNLLREYLPQDVVVRTKHEIVAEEKRLFEFSTPVGIVFRFSVVTAIVVGIIVVYQLLFQLTSKYLVDLSDRLFEIGAVRKFEAAGRRGQRGRGGRTSQNALLYRLCLPAFQPA